MKLIWGYKCVISQLGFNRYHVASDHYIKEDHIILQLELIFFFNYGPMILNKKK